MKIFSLSLFTLLLAFAFGKAELAGWNKIDQISMEVGSNYVNYYATTSENGGYWVSNCPPATPIRYIWVQGTSIAAKEIYSMLLTGKSTGAKMKFGGTCQGEYLLVTTNAYIQ